MISKRLSTLLLLSLVCSTSAHVLIRQDTPSEVSAEVGSDPTDAGDSFDFSSQSTASEMPDTAVASAAPDVEDSASSAVSSEDTPTPSASATARTGSRVGELGGAGIGGVYPVASAECVDMFNIIQYVYQLIELSPPLRVSSPTSTGWKAYFSLCSSQGSSESCSPICTAFTSATSCLSCLVTNGQTNFDEVAAQQVAWNLESTCQDLELRVKSVEIKAAPTTT